MSVGTPHTRTKGGAGGSAAMQAINASFNASQALREADADISTRSANAGRPVAVVSKPWPAEGAGEGSPLGHEFLKWAESGREVLASAGDDILSVEAVVARVQVTLEESKRLTSKALVDSDRSAEEKTSVKLRSYERSVRA